MTRIVPPQAQRSGSTSNTFAMRPAPCRRHARCDGAKASSSRSPEAGLFPAPAIRRARAPRVRLA
jgi:hypothetical protein